MASVWPVLYNKVARHLVSKQVKDKTLKTCIGLLQAEDKSQGMSINFVWYEQLDSSSLSFVVNVNKQFKRHVSSVL
jgi:hypothetical protein